MEKTIVLEINYIMFRFSVPRWNVKQRRGFKDLPGIEIRYQSILLIQEMIHIKFHFITPLNICDAPIHKKAV
jgi:hypothetical protein